MNTNALPPPPTRCTAFDLPGRPAILCRANWVLFRKGRRRNLVFQKVCAKTPGTMTNLHVIFQLFWSLPFAPFTDCAPIELFKPLDVPGQAVNCYPPLETPSYQRYLHHSCFDSPAILRCQSSKASFGVYFLCTGLIPHTDENMAAASNKKCAMSHSTKLGRAGRIFFR